MADSLALVWPVQHIRTHPENTSDVEGQCNVVDERVAPWCAENGLVLVTIDSGFQARWVKTGLLAQNGLEVIVFSQDLKGPREQHSRISRHLPHWIETLNEYDYGYRVWSQGPQNKPEIRIGGKRKRPVSARRPAHPQSIR